MKLCVVKVKKLAFVTNICFCLSRAESNQGCFNQMSI